MKGVLDGYSRLGPSADSEDLVGVAISKKGNMYRTELTRLIGASKESLEGKSPLYMISLMKLCGFAEADVAKILRESKVVDQRDTSSHDLSQF